MILDCHIELILAEHVNILEQPNKININAFKQHILNYIQTMKIKFININKNEPMIFVPNIMMKLFEKKRRIT